MPLQVVCLEQEIALPGQPDIFTHALQPLLFGNSKITLFVNASKITFNK